MFLTKIHCYPSTVDSTMKWEKVRSRINWVQNMWIMIWEREVRGYPGGTGLAKGILSKTTWL